MECSKILVSINGTKADDEAVRLACSLAKKAKGKVYVSYVIEIKRTLPLDVELAPEIKKGEDVLVHAEHVAEEQDYEIEPDLLQARKVGPALVDEAIERGVDLIIMALDYKESFGEFSLGSAVPYVLRNAPCRVLVCREPIPTNEIE